MKKRVIVSLILTAVTITLSGCNSPKTASKENFAKLINQRIAKNPHTLPNSRLDPHCTIELRSLPHEIRSIDYGPRKLAEQYAALEKAGLMTSEVVKEEDSIIGKIITTKYDISDKGRQIAKASGNHDFSLPYCQVAFKEVKSFTEPEDEGKTKSTYVEYTYVVEKVDDWVRNPEILQQFAPVKAVVDAVGQPKDAGMYLILAKEGWEFYREP